MLVQTQANAPAIPNAATLAAIHHYVVAQVNAGRYGDSLVLSPAGIAAMHTEPPPRGYGPGGESIRVNGRRLINLDGGTASFPSSLFFDPEARLGVYLSAIVVNALDTFSSPSGSSPLEEREVGSRAML